jgi:hypothetical protein
MLDASSTTRSYKRRSPIWKNEENLMESSQPEERFASKGGVKNG